MSHLCLFSCLSDPRILYFNRVIGFHKSQYDHYDVLRRNPDALNFNFPRSAITTWKTREILRCEEYLLAGTQIICCSMLCAIETLPSKRHIYRMSSNKMADVEVFAEVSCLWR